MGDFGGDSLEHPRQWLGAQWAGLSPGSAEPPRAARRALRRHRSRAGALPRGHFDPAVAPPWAHPRAPRPRRASRGSCTRRSPRARAGTAARPSSSSCA
eukprot:scaffold96431_cov44-Phaeocystis_antarctica.AAC.2